MADVSPRPQALVAVPPGRVPPHSLDAERSLLGGILLDNAALYDVTEILEAAGGAGAFYREAHRKIYEAMVSLFAKSEPVDRVTVKDELRALGALAAVGGDSFIDLLDTVVPSASNLVYYGTIVHEKACARRLIEASHAISAQSYEGGAASGDLLDDAERRIFAVTEQKAQTAFMHVREIVKGTFKTIESLYERQEEVTGMRLGLPDLDRMTSGFQPGDLVILAARPSMGKTAWALNASCNVGCRGRFPAFPTSDQRGHLLAGDAQGAARHAHAGERGARRRPADAHRAADRERLGQAGEGRGRARRGSASTSTTRPACPRSSCARRRGAWRRAARSTDAPLGLIVIDYLQLMRGNEKVRAASSRLARSAAA
jgi:replicative DNA helicase